MANKKKLAVSAVAIAAAASMLLGGTFAWQSISQTALNEKEAVTNPGGRLHDDFDGKNKDVYVENFADEAIFARVRLDEYFEIVMNKGTDAEKSEIITKGAEKDKTSTYITHIFSTDDDKNATDSYWEWKTGGSTVYMPTFNKNKDSLKADVNGTLGYKDAGGNANPYGDYVDYSQYTGENEGETEVTGEGAGKTENAVYDNDANTIEDDGVKSVEETHYVSKTGTAKFISMTDWLALNNGTYSAETHGNYWVYDTDGWVYWSSPIEAGKATGLLLDEISLKQSMDDSYYYAINVVAQFITADDLGKTTGTGFYDTKAGETPSDNALTLLKKIGVDTSGEDYVSPLVLKLTPEKSYYLTGSADTDIDITLSATYDEEAVEVSKLSDVKWSVKGFEGDLSSGTKLTGDTDGSKKLTVWSGETDYVIVTVSATYQGEKVKADTWIQNGPEVSGRVVYYKGGNAVGARGYYEAGTTEYEMLFYQYYKSSVNQYDRKDAYTDELQKYIAKNISWVLVDDSGKETTVTGVTVTTDAEDPAKCTVTVTDGFEGAFNLGCKEKDNVFVFSKMMQKATSVTLGAEDKNTDSNSTISCEENKFTLTATGSAEIQLKAVSVKHGENMSSYNFENLSTTASDYTIKTVTEYGVTSYYLCKADVEDENITSDFIVKFAVGYGYAGVYVRDFETLSENIAITGKVKTSICGVTFENDLNLTLQNPTA